MTRVLVTGASTGLGLLTATSLIEEGHEVVLHARRRGRFEDESVTGRATGVVYGDLARLDEVRRVARTAGQFGPYDAVIHNAGVLRGPDLVAVNVVAPYALTALMPRTRRMIVVSSSMHLGGSPYPPAESVSGAREISYSDSKLLATAFTMGIARLWPDTLAHCLCPGWVPTRMGGPSATDDLIEGHRTQEWLATVPESTIDPRTGGYWHHLAPQRPHPATLDADFQDQLFAALEDRTGLALPR